MAMTESFEKTIEKFVAAATDLDYSRYIMVP
jgi:hypothetical protein